MRLFTAIDISPEVRQRLELFLAPLRPLAKLSWSAREKLHITTRFIGEWPEDRLNEMKSALNAVPRAGGFQVSIRGIGWFPNQNERRVFWAGVDGGEMLPRLAQATDQALEKLALPREEKPYSPHLTLARIRKTGSLNALEEKLRGEVTDFGSFSVSQFFLYRSAAGKYTRLEAFPLQ
jgi:2'-5' RNA ligase